MIFVAKSREKSYHSAFAEGKMGRLAGALLAVETASQGPFSGARQDKTPTAGE
jgi:hypothetical protein